MFEFKTVEKPVLKRVENPFIDVVKGLEPGSDKALTFSMPNSTGEERKAVRVALRQLTEAGNENNVTVRRSIVENSKLTEITFWAVPKIVHSKLDDETEKEIVAEVKEAIAKKG